jgi:hypothetical protein
MWLTNAETSTRARGIRAIPFFGRVALGSDHSPTTQMDSSRDDPFEYQSQFIGCTEVLVARSDSPAVLAYEFRLGNEFLVIF